MMGKTHLTMGIAVTALAFHPTDIASWLLTIVGGAVGGTVADIDSVKTDYKHDALIGQALAVFILGASLLIDYGKDIGILSSIAIRNSGFVIVGGVVYLILYIVGFFSRHRTFTHSLFALALFSFSVYLICPSIATFYAVGYLSHLVLDILNKKTIPLFFPVGKGFCLGWFYANKIANKCFFWTGFVSIFLLMVHWIIVQIA